MAGNLAGEATFYIGDSPELYSSTERITSHPAQPAITSPSRAPRTLQRSDFSTFQPVHRTHRVNGRDNGSLDHQVRPRRPTMSSYQSQPARLLGQSGRNRSRYEFRDSVGDAAELQQQQQQQQRQRPRRTENWRSLTHQHDQTVTSVTTDFDRRANNNDIAGIERRNRTMWSPSPYSSNDPVSSPPLPSPAQQQEQQEQHQWQFAFPLLPLDEARRRQAEARSRGEEDQTFLSSSTVRPSLAFASSSRPASSTASTRYSGAWTAFIVQAERAQLRAQQRAASLLAGGRRRSSRRPPGASITRTTRQADSFTSVMRAGIEAEAEQQQLGAEAHPRAFLPSVANTDSSAPPTLHPRPSRRRPSFPPFLSSGRYGNIRDEDVELGVFRGASGGAGVERGRVGGGGGGGGGNRLARRWSS
jgi:hypothetical protein